MLHSVVVDYIIAVVIAVVAIGVVVVVVVLVVVVVVVVAVVLVTHEFRLIFLTAVKMTLASLTRQNASLLKKVILHFLWPLSCYCLLYLYHCSIMKVFLPDQ